MKKLSFGLLLFLLSGTSVFAQDLITTRTGEDIQGRVTEIGLTEVKYHPLDAPEGSVSTISKDKVLLIRYKDGGKEIFEQPATAPPDLLPESASKDNNTGVVSALSNTSMFMRGQIDAKRYYNGYKEAGTATLISSILLGPLFGLVPTVIIATTVPQTAALNYPNDDLMRNREYAQGYVREAKSIKSHKTWVNYAIGVGVSTVLAVILLAIALSSFTIGW